MKKFNYFLLFIAGTYTHLYAQNTFKAILNINQPSIFHFQQLANYDILYTEGYKGLTLSRYSADGMLKWSKMYGDSLTFIGIASNKTKNNGIIVLAAYKDTNYSFRYLIFKCDYNGNILWQNCFFTPDYGQYTVANPTICEAPDGNIYVGAGDWKQFFQIVKFDNNGKPLWHKRYYYGSTGSHVLGYMTTDNNGNVLVKVSDSGCDFFCIYSIILKVDKNGSQMWNTKFPQDFDARSFEDIGDDKLAIVFTYKPYNQKARYVASVFDYNTGNNRNKIFDKDAFTLKFLLQSNNTVYAKGIQLDNFYIKDNWSILKESNDTVYNYDTKNRVCPRYSIPSLVKVKDTIYTTEKKVFFELSDSSFKLLSFNLPVKSTQPGFFITCSGKAMYNNTDTVPVAGSHKHASAITVSPNPVKNVLKISGLPIYQKSFINIVNRNGNVLQSLTAQSSSYNLNVAQLKSGVYNVVATINDKTQSIKFVKE